MIITIIIASVLLFTFAIVIIDWTTHIEMVKDHSDSYGKTGHKEFIKQFNHVEWTFNPIWEESLFGKNHSEDYYHAGVIKFNHNGMIVNNPISYLIVKFYVKRYIKLNHSETKVNSWR